MTATFSRQEATQMASDLLDMVNQSVFGQEGLVTETICCLLAGGHILMTGAPGLAKTTLVRVFSRSLGLEFGRVQFTPDLLPSDIVGSDILNVDPASGQRAFEFSKGPVFTNLLLADEINRASPRTQSALLEAMQERTCTIGGRVHELPDPFMVFATQNPFESEGTFPLPEAQLDRFLVHTLVDYPTEEAEQQILKAHASNKLVGEQRDPGRVMERKVDADSVRGIMARTEDIPVEEELVKMINELVRATRPSDDNCPQDIRDVIWYGAGPRAGISLISMSRAFALLDGADEVRWRHIRRMAAPVLRHRIRLTARAGRNRMTEDSIIKELLERLESRHKLLARGVS